MRWLWMIGAIAAAVGMVGCSSGGAYQAYNYGESIEKSQNIVFYKKALQKKISLEGITASYLPDGRLSVQANLLNRKNKPIILQVQTVFQDEQGFSTGDETSWERIKLKPRETYTYSAQALNSKSKRFVIRVDELAR